jgi:UDP-galactopyranose mutase
MPNYNLLFDNLSKGIEVQLEVDYLQQREQYDCIAEHIIYTGPIDQFYNYKFGPLEYRSLIFKEERLGIEDFQGTFMMSYPEAKYDFTRIIEHKHFEFGKQSHTVITREYPDDWSIGKEAYYPVNDDKNQQVYNKYYTLSKVESKVTFGGRMGSYKYLNMDETIEISLELVQKILDKNV